jgi:sugar phosphate permease
MLLLVYTLVEAPSVGWGSARTLVSLLGQLRGWSSLATGLAIFPAGALVAGLSPRIAPLIGRFGVTRLAVAGLSSIVVGYILFLPIGLDSRYVFAMLPTFLLAGLGFGLAFGPLNVAATSGVAPEEQGLAGGLVNTSFQLGAALVLAVVTAVASANTTGGSPEDILAGFHAALFVPIGAAVLGVVAMLHRRAAPAVAVEPPVEEALEEAA